MITRVASPESVLLRNQPQENAAFKRGEVFRGQVVRDLGKGEVLIQSKGNAFRAFTEMGVKEGEQYDFRVTIPAGKNSLPILAASPTRVVARAADQRPESIAGLLSHLALASRSSGLGPRTAGILRNLSQSIPAFIYRDQGGDPSAWMSRFLAEGGLFWEGKVARYLMQGGRGNWRGRLGNDLKGILLDLKKSLSSESRDQPEIQSISRKVDEALDFIQKTQLENREFLREGICSFFVPGRAEEGFEKAEIYIRRYKKDKETRFSMSLNFSVLGIVEVTASILEPEISARFDVTDENKAELIRENLPLLEGALKEKGLIPGRMVCHAVGTAPEDETLPWCGPHTDSINLVI